MLSTSDNEYLKKHITLLDTIKEANLNVNTE